MNGNILVTVDRPVHLYGTDTHIGCTDQTASRSESKQTIDGADLFDRACAFVRRFVRPPSESSYDAMVLWAVHTHLMEAWDTTPRIAFLSAEPGSGKSRAMEIVALLAPLALEAANATTASLVRALDDPAGRPTFFIDEIDTKYGPKAKGDEELRGMINAGHRRGGYFLRCEMDGDRWIPVRREAYAAVAMAGIGDLPDTILTRSVILKMRKRAPHERVEPYRQRDHMGLGHALRDELEMWANQVRADAAAIRPLLPAAITDRNADVWEPLIAVADLAGGDWPARAREAAIQLIDAGKATTKPSLGVQLLSDIRDVFGDATRLPTKVLLDCLLADEEAPWGDLSGRKVDDRKLAKLLAPYEIKPKTIRMPDGTTPRGYERDAFHDAWERQLPLQVGNTTSATGTTSFVHTKAIEVPNASGTGSPACGGSIGDFAQLGPS